MPISTDQLDLIQKGGMVLLLLIAIWWLDKDRRRLIAENKSMNDKLTDLSERTIVAMVELRGTVRGVADIFKNGSKRH